MSGHRAPWRPFRVLRSCWEEARDMHTAPAEDLLAYQDFRKSAFYEFGKVYRHIEGRLAAGELYPVEAGNELDTAARDYLDWSAQLYDTFWDG